VGRDIRVSGPRALRHLEKIPPDCRAWHAKAAGPARLAAVLAAERDRALRFRTLATLCTDVPVFEDVEDLRWTGPTPAFAAMAAELDAARGR
jgi:hypothetical protein